MVIPNEIVNQLHQLDCEEVATQFQIVEVKGHQAHCFLHEDKHPSLSFRRNHWKCFSCDKGGDAISLVIERFSMSFIEACVLLCHQFNIPLPYKNNTKQLLARTQHRPKKISPQLEEEFDHEVASFII